MDRLTFIDNLKSGKQKIFITDELQLTLHELFDFLETKHNLVPIAAGNEGKVFKFGSHLDHGVSFVVKVIENAKQPMEPFFVQWLSKEVAEKGKSTAFPFYIDSRKNMIAIEFIDHLSLFPYYLFRNLISEREKAQAQLTFKSYEIKASNITPEERNLKFKSIFLQIIHGLYLIQGVNLHGFRHNDLHGRNVMIRKRTQKDRLVLTFFSSKQLMDVILPDFGIEAVISDFGLSSYPGIGESGQFLHPLKGLKNDMDNVLTLWIDTFKKLKWVELTTQSTELLSVFKKTPRNFPPFDSILNTDMFRNVFDTAPSKKDPKDLYISLLPRTKRFTETEKIADAWLTKEMPLKILEIRNNLDSDVDFFIGRMERFLKIPSSLYSLTHKDAGFRMLIRSLPLINTEEWNDVTEYHLLDDFSDSNLDEILKVLTEFGIINKFMLAFAIKNNVI